MDNILGLKLIKELQANPSKFNNQGRVYQLLQEYFRGFPLETLRPLLCHGNILIRRMAVWIVSELGAKGNTLLHNVVSLINDDDRYIKYHVLEVIAVCSGEEDINEYLRVFPFLEDDDSVLRILVMRLISNAGIMELEHSLAFYMKDILGKIHVHGLSILLDVNNVSSEQIQSMLYSTEALTRKYGIIAAKKLFPKYPNLINDALTSEDADISKFSKEVIEIYSNL